MVAQVFHFYAGAVDKHYGETIPVAGGVDMTFREPMGVIGMITPWNFPLVIAEGAGHEMRRTLGMAVFAGMIGVTLFGLFLTPVFYFVVRWIVQHKAPAKEAVVQAQAPHAQA